MTPRSLLPLLLLGACQAPPGPAPRSSPGAAAAPTPLASLSIAPSTTVTNKSTPPKPELKPEPSVCKQGVVTECEFWRAALRQTLRLDPLCAEDDPTFRYPWGADGNLRRLKIQYPGAKSCDVDIGDNITIRCYFPLRSPSESATTRARGLAESFNACVSEEFSVKMVVEGNEDALPSVDLSPMAKEAIGLTASWRNQTEGGKAGTDQLKIYFFNAVWVKPGLKQPTTVGSSLPKPTPSASTATPKAP